MQGRSRDRRHAQEAAQYRAAAEAVLGQLDWVINYLKTINRPRIAEAIRRNRDEIAKRL